MLQLGAPQTLLPCNQYIFPCPFNPHLPLVVDAVVDPSLVSTPILQNIEYCLLFFLLPELFRGVGVELDRGFDSFETLGVGAFARLSSGVIASVFALLIGPILAPLISCFGVVGAGLFPLSFAVSLTELFGVVGTEPFSTILILPLGVAGAEALPPSFFNALLNGVGDGMTCGVAHGVAFGVLGSLSLSPFPLSVFPSPSP